MNPYVYDGFDPKIAFWITASLIILFIIGCIYEGSRNIEGWDKKSWLSVGLTGILGLASLGLMLSADLGDEAGFKEAAVEASKLVEVDGLSITSGEINPEPGNVSNVTVKLAGTEDDSSCNLYAPDDASKAIEVLCGTGTRGMHPTDLVRWFKDGKPVELETYEVSDEDSKRIVGSVEITEE